MIKYFKISWAFMVLFIAFVIGAVNNGWFGMSWRDQQDNAAMVTCQEITMKVDYYTHDSVQRCEMPDGTVCYLFGAYGSISCLSEQGE